ncbi:uncharacterized protein LOC135818918 [Sycon ciliatum]|uniref:uncharacterized protein LOC135818918 n=1 Tax=Sycon ciliatum TaxID=27933 RepID=UPI0031F712B5
MLQVYMYLLAMVVVAVCVFSRPAETAPVSRASDDDDMTHAIRCPTKIFPTNAVCQPNSYGMVCGCRQLPQQPLRPVLVSAEDVNSTLMSPDGYFLIVRCTANTAKSSLQLLPEFRCEPITPPEPRRCTFSAETLPQAIRMSQDMLIFDSDSSVAQNESYPSGTKLSISGCKQPWTLQRVRTGVDPVLTCVDGQWTLSGHGSPLCQACRLSAQGREYAEERHLVVESNATAYAIGSNLQLKCKKHFVQHGDVNVPCYRRPEDNTAVFGQFPRCEQMMCDMTDLSRLGMRAINGHRSRGFIRVGKSVNITCAKPRRAPASRDQQHHGHHGSNQLRYHGKKMVATCFPPLHATDHDGQLNWVGRFLVASPNEAEESSLRAASRSMNCR